MSELGGSGAELRCVVTITRADTGKVETYQVVGRMSEAELAAAMAAQREAANSGQAAEEDQSQQKQGD